MLRRVRYVALLPMSAICFGGSGAEGATLAPDPAPVSAAAELHDESNTTHHQILIAGKRIDYEATASRMVLRKANGESRASIFSIQYIRAVKASDSARPVMFCFQGGPGAPAIWVNLGAFGPRHVELDAEGRPTPKTPHQLIDNEFSVLDAADLVFIDPIATGFSRPAPGVDASEFLGYRNDIESVADFIALWMTRNGRWGSPVFIAGESYGTIRAVGLAKDLQERYALYPSGLVLISAGLNWYALDWDAGLDGGNDLPFIAYLPTYAAIAQFHKKLPPDLSSLSAEELRHAAEQFAIGEYASALMKGDQLPPTEQNAIATKLSRFTGLPSDFIATNHLRVPMQRFRKRLLHDETQLIDTEDGRITALDPDPTAADAPNRYPFSELTDGSFIGLMNLHVREELGFKTDLSYALAPEVWDSWNMNASPQSHSPPFIAGVLRDVMARNQSLRVLITSGVFDMATPYFATDLALDHAQLAPSERARISVEHYAVGHYVYIRSAVRPKLRAAVLSLVRLSAAPP